MVRNRSDIVLELNRSPLASSVPLDLSDLYRSSVLIGLIPWRGMALGVALLCATAVVLPPLISNTEVLWTLWFILVAVPISLEWVNTRDFLTKTALVRQSGILGRKRLVVPLAEIDRVEFSFPRFGQSRDVGDIHVHYGVHFLVLQGIAHPARKAQQILDTKGRLLAAPPDVHVG